MDFSGRSSRLGFWRVQLICSALSSLIWVLAVFAAIRIGAWSAPLFLPILLLLAPLAAVGLRRAHDRGRDWRWLAMLSLGPYLLGMSADFAPALISPLLRLACLLLGLWAWVELGFLKGDPGSNAYGPPPGPDTL